MPPGNFVRHQALYLRTNFNMRGYLPNATTLRHPFSKRYLMLKSRVHWRAGLGDLASDVVECADVGVCTSHYSQLCFRRLRRPMYPLDR